MQFIPTQIHRAGKLSPWPRGKRLLCALAALLFFVTSYPVIARAADTGTATSDVILRTKASSSSVPLATVGKGREVNLIEKQGEWYKVKTGSLTGYVMAKYIKENKESSSSPSSSSSSSSSSSGKKAGMLQSGDSGSEVSALQQALKSLGFFSGEVTGNFGPQTKEAVIALQKAKGLTADGVAGPGTMNAISQGTSSAVNTSGTPSSGNSSVIKKGDEGDAVLKMQQNLKNLGFFPGEVTGYFGAQTEQALMDFQRSRGLNADGVAGSATLNVLLTSTAVSGGSTVVRLGDKGSSVSELQLMLKNTGYYTGPVDGDYGEGTKSAVMAMQSANGLTPDGVAGTKTIQLLSSGSARVNTQAPVVSVPGNSTQVSTAVQQPTQPQSNGSMKLVDWWGGEINAVYPRKGIAQVLDIRTGITFSIYRYGGTNHLDFEPATAADTALMLQIAGGAWSWSARPCVLIVGGNRYAAAMNTMPHGEYHLTDNNCNGQMCMHFLNSKTHGGGKPNADMQMQVMVAYNSGK